MREGMFSFFKTILTGLLFIACIALFLFVFIKGAHFAVALLPYAYTISIPVFLLDLILFFPLALIYKTKNIGAVALMISSYIFGFVLWGTSTILVWYNWGLIWVIVGIFFAGVGVAPMAVALCLFRGYWPTLILLLMLALLTFGIRSFSIFAIEREPKNKMPKEDYNNMF